MAIIGSIRKRGTLVIGVIGVSLLALILGLRFSNYFTTGPDDSVAVINGKKVNVNEFTSRQQAEEDVVKKLNPNAELDEMQRQQINERVWESIIRDRVYQVQFDKLGLKVTKEELNDMLTGETVHPNVRSQFVNQAGMFDPNMVVNFAAQLEQDPEAIPQEQRAQFEASKIYWGLLQQEIKKDRIMSKYNNMVMKGLYVTSKETQSMYSAMNTRANVRYVFKPYMSIADSSVTLTDAELNKYYKDFGYKFRQKKSRALKYVVFMAIPTSADSTALRDSITAARNRWESVKDDTLFVYQNAEDPIDPGFYRRGSLSKLMDSLLFDAPDGTIAGPFLESGYYMVGRKVGERMVSDSVKARHILLQPKSQEEYNSMVKLRDSLMTVLENGGNFAEICAQYSADQSNAKDTGNLGWFTEGMMVAPFSDTCFASAKGELKKADTQFGLHIIYIQDKTAPRKQSKIAFINKMIRPSDATMKDAHTKASEFALVDTKQKGFDSEAYFVSNATKNNFMLRDEPFLTESSRQLMGMDNTGDIVKWALSGKRGDISDVYEVGYAYVVCLLTAVRTDGIPPLEDIKGEVKLRAIQHKKAEQFIGEFNSALGSSKTVDALANAMKLQVLTAADVTYGSFFIPGAGVEPDLIGTIFGLKAGQLSKPIEGNNGVFVVVPDVINVAPPAGDLSMLRMQIMQGLLSRASNEIGNTLKEKAKVKDNRYKFDLL